MLLKRLFNASHVEEFAKSLVAEFARQFPPSLQQEGKKAEKKLTAALRHLHQRAQQFQAEHKMGIYQKAKFSNTLKWELKESGYEDAMIDGLIKDLLFSLARKPQ